MIVLDTHAWLWWETQPQRLPPKVLRLVEDADRIGVCTISVMELAGIVARDPRQLKLPLRRWVNRALERDRVLALPLTTAVAIDAGRLRFAGDPADRITYASARAADAQLVTRDEPIHAFDPERAVW